MDASADYYDILQVSQTAEPETVHRVYRLLAQRLHPDNRETGNGAAFRTLCDAYAVLSDPQRRAQYDVLHAQKQKARWRLVSSGNQSENDFETERLRRLTVLEVLYTRRRLEPGNPGLSPSDIEELIGTAREHLEFTCWYLGQKKFVTRNDASVLTITSEGVDHLEANYAERRRLTAGHGVNGTSAKTRMP